MVVLGVKLPIFSSHLTINLSLSWLQKKSALAQLQIDLITSMAFFWSSGRRSVKQILPRPNMNSVTSLTFLRTIVCLLTEDDLTEEEVLIEATKLTLEKKNNYDKKA